MSERITRRRSIPVATGYGGYGNGNNRPQWQNPSIHNPQDLGGVWDFLLHKYLFYSSDNPNGWDYIVDDSMKFSFRLNLFQYFSTPKFRVLYRVFRGTKWNRICCVY